MGRLWHVLYRLVFPPRWTLISKLLVHSTLLFAQLYSLHAVSVPKGGNFKPTQIVLSQLCDLYSLFALNTRTTHFGNMTVLPAGGNLRHPYSVPIERGDLLGHSA